MTEIKELCRSYGKKIILDNISLNIPDNKCIGILGANGCGKTTFLSTVAGVTKPDSGQIILSDNNMQVGYVPQENPLIPDLSAYDNMLLWYKGSRSEFKNALKGPLIEMLGINSYLKQKIKKISGGMKKKVSIAMALINEPTLLIMDEPSAALDLNTKAEIARYLINYKTTTGSIIITTHEESELEICDYLYILKDGHLTNIPRETRGSELINLL